MIRCITQLWQNEMIRTQNRNSFFKTTNHATKHPCNNKNSRCTSILTQNITKLLQRYITVNCQKQVKKHNPCTHPKRYNLSKNNNNIIIKFKKINKARNEKKKRRKPKVLYLVLASALPTAQMLSFQASFSTSWQ